MSDWNDRFQHSELIIRYTANLKTANKEIAFRINHLIKFIERDKEHL